MGKTKESATKKRAVKKPAQKSKVSLSEKPVADPKPAAPELKAQSRAQAKTKPKSRSRPKSPPGRRTPGTRRYKPELTLVRKVIKRFKDNLQEDTVTPSVGDLIRLLQMKKDMEGESPREIKVAWVDPESTKSSEE